jgi:lipopolysaccharide transport system ATP-binding protein
MDAPVQNYSSGMSVRLGFAIAVVLVKPDILLLDEVLAVGDMGFMIKCLNAVRELANKCAVVFVSHNMQFVSSFCSEVLVLTQGKVHLHSLSVAEGVDAYLRLFPIPADASGSGGAEITKAKIHHDGESDTTDIAQGINAALDFHLLISEGTMDTILNVYIMDQAQTPIICYPDLTLLDEMLTARALPCCACHSEVSI